MGTCLKLFGAILLLWGTKSVFSLKMGRPSILMRGVFPMSKYRNPCENQACYPATGNLVVGREKQLRASSTCGLNGAERFCTKDHGSNSEIKKCFRCDSRPEIKSPLLNHGVEQLNRHSNNLPSILPWWQSENGVEDVTIQLDLESVFHVTHIILAFKSYPPKAMYIEKSNDFGKSWNIVRYFAQNCTEAFPGVRMGRPIRHSEAICDSRISRWSSPALQGEIIYRVLSAQLKVVDPYSEEIQNLLKWTNVRFRFVKLHTVDGEEPSGENKENYYYSMQQLIVRGSCLCNGHASRCIPADGDTTGKPENMVHSKCQCTHNTKGNQCEVCDAHYDLPWKPAVNDDVSMCKNKT